MGLNATLTKVKQRFYWPKLRSFVMQKLDTCLTCVKKNRRTPALDHQLYHEYSSYFNQRICIDTVGPLSPTKYHGQTVIHILTIQDTFTRFFAAVPVTDIEAKTLSQHVIDTWILHHGVPEQIHTDRGSSFTSALFSEVMRTLGITKTVTPAYTPRGD